MPHYEQTRFSSGEVTPRLSPLSDTEAHENSCILLREAIVTEMGGAKKRPGTEVVAEPYEDMGTPQTPCRLFSYRHRKFGDFILEFYEDVFRYYLDGGSATMGQDSSSTDIDPPWDEDEYPMVYVKQIEDELYMCHPNHMPHVLKLKYTKGSFGGAYTIWWELGPIDSMGSDLQLDPVRKDYPFGIEVVGTNVPLIVAGTASNEIQAFKETDNEDGGLAVWLLSESNWMRAQKDGGYFTRGNHQAHIDNFSIGNDPRQLAKVDSGAGATGEDGLSGAFTRWVGPWLKDDTANTSDITMPSGSGAIPVGEVITVSFASGDPNTFTNNNDIGRLLFIDDNVAHPAVVVGLTGTSNELKIVLLNSTGSAPAYSTTYTTSWYWWDLHDRGTPRDGVAMVADKLTGTDIVLRATYADGRSGNPSVFSADMPAVSTSQPAARVYMNGGAFEILTYQTEYRVVVQPVEGQEPSTFFPTTCWSLGMSYDSGYPRCVELHQERLAFGGIPKYQNRLYLSKTGKYKNFTTGNLDNDALVLALPGEHGGGIQWLKSMGGDLLVGTEDNEYAVKGEPLTIKDLGRNIQSSWGGSSIEPLVIDRSVIFATKDKRGVRALQFEFQSDQYVSQDLTDRASHLFDDNQTGDGPKAVCDIAYLRDPDSILLVLLENGWLLSLTYRPSEGIVAWSPWNISSGLGDRFVSMAVRRVDGSDDDELWLITERGTGSGTRFIEKLSTSNTDADFLQAFASASIDLGTGQRNRTFSIFNGDGDWVENLTLDENGQGMAGISTGTLGLPVTMLLTPQVREGRDSMGTTHGRTRNITAVRLQLYDSYGGVVDDNHFDDEAADLAGTTPVYQTRWVRVETGDYGDNARPEVLVKHNTPHRFEIMEMVIETDGVGD